VDLSNFNLLCSAAFAAWKESVAESFEGALPPP